MTAGSVQPARATLRTDLTSIQVDGRVRPFRIVIDEIGGRFARVSEHVWQRLQDGEADAELWAEANAAGWLRTRNQLPKRRFSPLMIQVRLGSIDSVAKRFAEFSGIFFSPLAIAWWLMVIVLAAVAVASRADQWFASLGSLPAYLKQSNPLVLAILFVFTKTVHELAHAVMCRRLGSRCGDVGVLFLCGMPCPYCDVTDIWRQPSSVKRAWVMLAGIYVELIIAAVAAFVWMNSLDPSTQLAAMNVMLVCGVSTILFNANPLMRYDGYHVLADLLGSANLRHEARAAFESVFTRRAAGPQYMAINKGDPRSALLAIFHAASKLYRVFVACAIAALLIQFADWLGLRTLAIIVVVVFALLAVGRCIRSLVRVLVGEGRWRRVPVTRRIGPLGCFVGFLLFLMFVPVPQYRRAAGVIDVADARSVFIPEDGLVQEVLADFGQVVNEGDTLIRLDRNVMMVRQTKLEGDLRLARIRSEFARRVALDDTRASQPKAAAQWRTLQAAEEAVETQLVSMRQRVAEADVPAPVSGVVIPASANMTRGGPPSTTDLSHAVGTALPSGHAWCRVSESGRLRAALVLDARDRANIQVGSTVMISSTQAPHEVIKSHVVAVSAIRQLDSGLPQAAAYQVLCPLPAVDQQQLMFWVGQECRGVFRLPRRTLASVLTSWLEYRFRG